MLRDLMPRARHATERGSAAQAFCRRGQYLTDIDDLIDLTFAVWPPPSPRFSFTVYAHAVDVTDALEVAMYEGATVLGLHVWALDRLAPLDGLTRYTAELVVPTLPRFS